MIRALELFGCAGGMAEGFRSAGLPFTWSVDKNPEACASYLANLGHSPIQADVHDLPRELLVKWRPVDLVVADPPCSPWSNAGKRRGLADERDCLVATIKIIARLRSAILRWWPSSTAPMLLDLDLDPDLDLDLRDLSVAPPQEQLELAVA